MTALEARKAAAKREAASATRKQKKRERNEAHSNWNKETGDWNTAEEQVDADAKLRKKALSTKKWMEFFDNLAPVFRDVYTAEEYVEAESYQPPKQLTGQEQAALDAKKKDVCWQIDRDREANNWVLASDRASRTARAAAVGVTVRTEVGAEGDDEDDILWPVVASPSFVHEVWRSTSRTPEQEKALGDEQRAVTRLIRTKDFKCLYQTKEQRDTMIERATRCGLVVDKVM